MYIVKLYYDQNKSTPKKLTSAILQNKVTDHFPILIWCNLKKETQQDGEQRRNATISDL